MLQWIKRYFDLNYNGAPYDAIEKRKGQSLYLIGGGNQPVAQQVSAPKPQTKPLGPSGLSSNTSASNLKRPITATVTANGNSSSTSHSSVESLSIKTTQLESQISDLKL